MLKDNTERFAEALKIDLGRPAIESDLYVWITSVIDDPNSLSLVLRSTLPLVKPRMHTTT
jgi:hypothetical protein